jgi:hypothetical protein
MAEKPKMQTSTAEKELDKVQEQFESFDKQVKELTLDRMNLVPKVEYEGQTKLARTDLAKSNDIYLKPSNFVASREKFNEKFRQAYEYDKQYVQFIAENIEIRGEMIELWSKPYPGCPAEFWKIPVNKPVWAPRYIAEQLRRKFHHRLVMQEAVGTGSDQAGQYYGRMVADTTIQRLDARYVDSRQSISMASN